MDPKDDDILDSLDDGELRSSIESADRDGEWREDTKFIDPKLEAIAALLANAPHPTYEERRFAELDRRAAVKNAAAAAREPNRPAGAPGDWRHTGTNKAEPVVPPVIGSAPRKATSTLEIVRSIAFALAVFALVGALQGLIGGFSFDLWLRAGAAGLASGCAWALFANGRYRAAAAGATAHLVVFLTTSDLTNRTELTAVLLGLFVALVGSGAAGLMQEENEQPLG